MRIACLLLILAFAVPATADTISFTDFTSLTGLTLNGDAAGVGGVLRLTPASPSKRGSAFLTNALSLGSDQDFEVFFRYRIHSGAGMYGSDGMAFLIQSDSRGDAALGWDGGELGYGPKASTPTVAKITPSVIVEFDTHRNGGDPNGNHVALQLNGNAMAAPTAYGTPGFSLNGTSSHPSQYAWILYNGTTNLLEVFVGTSSTMPATPLFSYTIDIVATVGSTAYFGFSAGTGGGYNAHDIEAWSVHTVPEPAGRLLLLVAGGWMRFRNKRPE